MNFNKFDYLSKFWGLLLIVPLVFAMSCGTDEDPVAIEPIASFQFEVDAADFFKVSFTNFSQNATVYAWDFGDAGVSTDKDAVHTYAASGTYNVTLTASDADGKSATKSESVTITDPDEALTLLAGSVSKKWKLMRDGVTMGIGPNEAEFTAWWFLTNDGSRNCMYDDEVTFTRAGGFEFNDAGTMFGEGNVFGGTDLNETCFDATVANMTVGGVDKSAWLSSTSHTYAYDVANNKISLTGLGAWMGLVKLGTSGDVDVPQGTTDFGVKLISGGASGVDTLNALWDHPGGFWKVVYVSYANPADEPSLTAVKADFSASTSGLTATFTNKSSGATSYTWDFGDGGTSTDQDPTHTYAADGTYPVKLTATDGTETKDITKDVLIDSATPAGPAPTPTQDAANVISIYSDHFAALTGLVIDPDWGQATDATEVEIVAGDKAIKLAGLNYQGIDFGGAQDVSGKTMVHVDVWSKASETINLSLISAGNENAITLTTEAGAWKGFDIPLADYTAAVKTEVIQFKFDDATTGTSPTVFYDNLYFY
jgi:PKD repeat protein